MGEEEKKDNVPAVRSETSTEITETEKTESPGTSGEQGSTDTKTEETASGGTNEEERKPAEQTPDTGEEIPKPADRIPPPSPETTSPPPEPDQAVPTPKTPETTSAPKPEEKVSDDEEIMKFLQETEQKIYVVGAGGSGTNTLDRLYEMGTQGVNLIGVNTDARHLLKIKANKKMIIGKKVSGGKGAGSNPLIGEEAAKESLADIKESLKNASMVFVTCGLGGGTGTGSAPIIAQAARSSGALTVAVVTLPFSSEGKIRMENALQGLEKLRKSVDTLIVIKNDKLLGLVPNLPLNTAFKVCDEVLAGSVKGIAELVTKSGMMNVDFADLRTILASAGYAVIGIGEASIDAKHDERARIAVETALTSPLLDADISNAGRALINVIGGEDMTLKEAEYVVAETSKRINPDAHIIWGSRVEENLKRSSMRVLVVLAGVQFPQYKVAKHQDVEELDLDIIG